MNADEGGSAAVRWACALAGVLFALAPAAQAGDLATLLTELYGGDGIYLDTTTFMGTSHAPHFTTNSLAELNQFSQDLAASLGTFAFNSSVSSFTFDMETGVPVRTTDSLGPILSERATTLGARRLNVGFSYNRVDFQRFQGVPLDQSVLFFKHQDTNGDGILGPNPAIGFTSDIETDLVRVDLDIALSQDIFTLYGTFGLLKNLDVGIALPILSVDLKADAVGSVVRNATNPPSIDTHNFAMPPMGLEDPVTSSVKGHASGIGDLLLRGKYQFLRGDGWLPNLAAVGQVKFPTGDEYELLGTGDWRGLVLLVADETFGPVTPHVNLGYEIVGGESELNNLKYYLGFDARVHRRATAVFDLLGRFEPSGDGRADHLVDAAVGGKLAVFKSLVFVSNFIVPLNRDHGLRPDFIWALGLEYTFGGTE